MSKRTRTLADSVMDRIERQHVAMRPRWHFTLLAIAGIATAILLGALVVYLVDVLVVAYRIHTGTTPMYGARRHLTDMLAGFPWWIAALAAVSFAALVAVIRTRNGLYKIRTVWLVAAILAFALAIGVVWGFSPYSGMPGAGRHSGHGHMHPGSGFHGSR